MAFSSSGWNVIGAAKKGNAPSMYTYTSADAIATVNTSAGERRLKIKAMIRAATIRAISNDSMDFVVYGSSEQNTRS